MFRQWLSKWYRKIGQSLTARRRQRRQPAIRLFLEQLEDRWLPSTFVVNELSDTHAASLVSGMDGSGHVSLRSALQAADHLGGNQTIQFDPTLFAVPQTISLTLGVLVLQGSGAGSLTIQGPAAGVTISGNNLGRVFSVQAGEQASLTGLTISDGAISGNGAGIATAGNLTLTDCTISGNTAEFPAGYNISSGLGGGICNNGTLTIKDSTISGNAAEWGGGICNYVNGNLSVVNSTISGNTAVASLGNGYYGPITYGGTGAGILNANKATLTDTTITGNFADARCRAAASMTDGHSPRRS